MGEWREGDWECGGCMNRNYAFRSFCNRCKLPRLLMDTKTPPDSKWLPRIGDWICTACTNNNYASREKCKKCGQPKEVAAISAIAMPGASLPVHPHYFPRASGAVHQHVSLPKEWRNGDWFCICGFHNYSSRLQCKNCKASSPPAFRTKRLASEDVANEWDSKRPNQGYRSVEPESGVYTPLPFLHQTTMPALLGKGAKQWRNGDWMCTNCNNHNYASRSECNRCKTQRDIISQVFTPAQW